MMDRDNDDAYDGPASTLEIFLQSAVRSLSRLQQPVVVAACPNKHDDAGRYPDWLAVQVGHATWERSDYRFEGGDLEESARNPDDLKAAREVLDLLQNCQWRHKFESDTGHDLNWTVLALVGQHGAWWLVGPDAPGGHITYLIRPSGAFEEVGFAERIDQRIGHTRPLLLESLRTDTWAALHAAVPVFPMAVMTRSEEAGWQDAYAQLAGAVRSALFWMNTVPGALRFVATADYDPGDGAWGYTSRGWRSIALNGKWATQERFGQPTAYADEVKKHGAGSQLLDSIATLLENVSWRNLFT